MENTPIIYARGAENTIYKPPFTCINADGNNPIFEFSRMSNYEDTDQQDFIAANTIMDSIDPTFIFHAQWAPCKTETTNENIKIVNMENRGVSLYKLIKSPLSDFYIILVLFELLRPLIDIVNCYDKGYKRADDLNDGNFVCDKKDCKMILIDQNTVPIEKTHRNKELINRHCFTVISKAIVLIEKMKFPEKNVLLNKLQEIENLQETEPIQFVEKYYKFIEYCYKEVYPLLSDGDQGLIIYNKKLELKTLMLRFFPELEQASTSFKPAKKSIRAADLYSSWFVTDNDLNPSTFGADLNLQRFNLSKKRKNGGKWRKRKRKTRKRNYPNF